MLTEMPTDFVPGIVTIISGDSMGNVKFWDSRTCTQLYTFTAHGADVLCMAVSPVRSVAGSRKKI